MTYADKYALMKGYKISTGDDPDQEASVENSYTRQRNSMDKLLLTDDGGEYFVCSSCGNHATSFAKKDGSTMSARDMLRMSMKDFSKPLCRDCYKQALKG